MNLTEIKFYQLGDVVGSQFSEQLELWVDQNENEYWTVYKHGMWFLFKNMFDLMKAREKFISGK